MTFSYRSWSGQLNTPEAAIGCHYAPDFVYRYAHIPGITVGQAVRAGSEYAQRIAKAAS